MDKCKALNKEYNPFTKRCNVFCKPNQTRRADDFKCIAKKVATPKVATPKVATPKVSIVNPLASIPKQQTCEDIGKETNPYTKRCNKLCEPNEIRRLSDFKCIRNKGQDPAKTVRQNPLQDFAPPEVSPRRLANAYQKINRFTRKANEHFKKKKETLHNACNDSSICLILGSPVEGDIKDFFDNFINFRFLTNVKRIGKVSVSGFVHELKYTHRGYDAYAVIKSSRQALGDNLMYEYRVGQYINTFIKKFPCFVETYGLFSYNNEKTWTYNKNNAKIPVPLFKDHITNIDYDLGLACRKSKHIAVIIQHLKGVKVIKDLFSLNYKVYASNLFAILYQIYFPLSFMNFTHYDLHHENVLLYTPDATKYIHYHYHHPDGKVVSFKSSYVSKIIDYGKSFFDDGAENSLDIYNEVCKLPDCNNNTPCGTSNGFRNFKNGMMPSSFIQTSKRNQSHDLRFLHIVEDYFIKPLLRKHPDKTAHDRHVKQALSDFFDIPITYTNMFGTAEKASCFKPYLPWKKPGICNIHDAVSALEQGIQAMLPYLDDFYFNGLTKLGDMHVYSDGRPFTYN